MKEGIIDVQDITTKFSIKEGVPIFVKLYQKEKPSSMFSFSAEKESRVHILSISERTDGKLWDSFPESIGIVDHINEEKGIAHFIVYKKIDSIIKINQLKDKVEIGSKVLVKLKKVTKDRDSYYTVLSCSLTQQEPTENILKSFSGIISTKGEVGFVDDVFIDAHLMQEHYEYASTINGIAIINYNKKKGTWGWKAIRIE